MTQCPKCGFDTETADVYCRKCGADLATGVRPGTGAATGASATAANAPTSSQLRARRRKILVFAIAGSSAMTVGALWFTFTGGGGGRVEGTFVSTGKPIGDFTFTPAQCRSGDHMSFYGVVLVGNGPTEGGLLVAMDPANGKFLKVEVPGSCKPPDYEVCTEIMIKPEQCSAWDVDVSGTGVVVNDRRMMQGHARAECKFPEGGTVKVNLDFGRCF